MPTVDNYLDQAKYNFQLASFLIEQDYIDWAHTVMFYSALHYVNAAIISKRPTRSLNSHWDRRQELRHCFSAPTRTQYTDFETWAKNTRYLTGTANPSLPLSPGDPPAKAYFTKTEAEGRLNQLRTFVSDLNTQTCICITL